MTKEQRYQVQILVEDLEAAEIRKRNAEDDYARKKAAFLDYLASLETPSPSEVTHEP